MKFRTTFILIGSILFLSVFIFMQQAWRNKSNEKVDRRVHLFSMDWDSLTSLEFAHSNMVVQCVLENGVWMTGNAESGMGRADLAQLNAVVRQINMLKRGSIITAKEMAVRNIDLSEYGVDPPALKITAVDNRGRHVWNVGRKGAMGDVLYVQEEGGANVYTISQLLSRVVPPAVDSLRDRRVFSMDVLACRLLELRGSTGFIQVIKGSNGQWQIQQPLATRADASEVESLLKKLSVIRVEDFIADNVTDFSVYGLQGETRQISLGGVDESSSRLVFGDEIPGRPDYVYARRGDGASVFAVQKKSMDFADIKLEKIRNRRVLLLEPAAVDYISMSRGPEQLAMTLDTNREWKITSPVSWVADRQVVETWLASWNNAVVVQFDDVGTEETPEWSFVLGSSELGRTNRIYALPTHGNEDGLRIRRDDDSTVYQLNLPYVPNAGSSPLQFKDRLVWTIDPAKIQKLSLQQPSGAVYAIERQQDGVFMPVDAPEGSVVDTTRLMELLAQLKTLKAATYVTYDPRDLSGYGLDQPAGSLHIRLDRADQLGRVLLIGRKTTWGTYAMVQGHDVVFLLKEEVAEIFSQNLLGSRPVSAVDAEE